MKGRQSAMQYAVAYYQKKKLGSPRFECLCLYILTVSVQEHANSAALENVPQPLLASI